MATGKVNLPLWTAKMQKVARMAMETAVRKLFILFVWRIVPFEGSRETAAK